MGPVIDQWQYEAFSRTERHHGGHANDAPPICISFWGQSLVFFLISWILEINAVTGSLQMVRSSCLRKETSLSKWETLSLGAADQAPHLGHDSISIFNFGHIFRNNH